MIFFSEILELSAISVEISHLNTLKHCVAAELPYSNQLNRTKRLGLDVIMTLFLNSHEVPFLSKKMVLMLLVYKDFVSCDPVVPGAATRRDPTHQIKLLW